MRFKLVPIAVEVSFWGLTFWVGPPLEAMFPNIIRWLAKGVNDL